MKKYYSIAIFYLVAFMMTSCYPTQTVATLERWKGSSKSELYGNWGPPDRVTSDGSDGEIAIYSSSRTSYTSGMSVPVDGGVTLYSSPQPITTSKQYMFYINSRGTIYKWKFFRNGKEIVINW